MGGVNSAAKPRVFSPRSGKPTLTDNFNSLSATTRFSNEFAKHSFMHDVVLESKWTAENAGTILSWYKSLKLHRFLARACFCEQR